MVAGPEIYNHLLGQSEQKIRDLFKPAEDEWRKFREKSPLHVIVIDEIDAMYVCVCVCVCLSWSATLSICNAYAYPLC